MGARSNMNNAVMLNQLRRGVALQISISPEPIEFVRPIKIPDGFGGTMDGPRSVKTSTTVRISHRRAGVQVLETTANGLDTGFGLFVLADHNTILIENEMVTARGRKWRVGPVDALVKCGGVVAYQAPLIQG